MNNINIPNIRFLIGDLIHNRIKLNKDEFILIGNLTASIMGPCLIYILNKEPYPTYYTLVDGGYNKKIKLTESLEDYIKIINVFNKYSNIVKNEIEDKDEQIIIDEIKLLTDNIEFWDSLIN